MSLVADRPTPDSAPAAERTPPFAAMLRWLRRSGGDTSIALGALSVITFWTFGLGIVLGIGAIGAGVVATRSVTVGDGEPRSLEAVFGILSGVFGVVAGVIFLAVAGPHW
ncbi:hypothetical protein EGT67_12980 [Prescottella agglutinans]|uniref:DUF4190 domain-containing protein n=1 Tax=Prescottella agglutinans TaxID=1644129 RepID=A0A3S3BTR1_9NOCA|nr:hypothetical protein [Prescottella agglutinans]RVW09065.1 hypothetical protein EGT67_12980 [Prescottella agglutinans]